MTDVFYWIGLVVVAALAVCAVLFVLLRLYFWLLHDRFGTILFRKSERRLSIASWHRSKLLRTDGQEVEDDWPADDWVVNERPLYLSYEIGKRRLFILAGMLDGPRYRSIRGKHPVQS